MHTHIYTHTHTHTHTYIYIYIYSHWFFFFFQFSFWLNIITLVRKHKNNYNTFKMNENMLFWLFFLNVLLYFTSSFSFVLNVDFGPHFRFEQDSNFLASLIITLTTASAAIPNLVLLLSYSWKHMAASISTVKLLWWSVLVELCIRNRVTDHCGACFWQIWIPVRRIGSIWATYTCLFPALSLYPSHGWRYTS